ncbi:MAG TPA: SGNH/GDSL hydrolase family protein [Bacteroidia bacterium]|nr:SGNH/GDSL hydrolase family protein [Bacteroidia bacterium]
MTTNHKINHKTFALLALFFVLCFNQLLATGTNFVYTDVRSFEVLGQLPGITNFARLPNTAKDKVSNEIWSLSRHSTGVCIKFVTNSPAIKVKWTTTYNPSTYDMVLTGLRGVDLYCNVNKKWQYVNTAKFESRYNEELMLENADSTFKEYMLILPSYDEIATAEIGIIDRFSIKKPDTKISATPPIVIYGTSITQGAAASRPGSSYTSLLARALNKNVINLGFSGNGKFEKVFADYMVSAKPALIILDCTPNSNPEEIKKNLPELINAIRAKDEKVPILLIESLMRENAYFNKTLKAAVQNQNNTLKQTYNELNKQGVKGLHYLASEKLVGDDHEGTSDGTHPNDLGHYRFFIEVKKKLDEILK